VALSGCHETDAPQSAEGGSASGDEGCDDVGGMAVQMVDVKTRVVRFGGEVAGDAKEPSGGIVISDDESLRVARSLPE
jgi:hypothetical protein